MRYKYIGKIKKYIAGIGEVNPNDIIETSKPIENPEFKLYTVKNSKKNKL